MLASPRSPLGTVLYLDDRAIVRLRHLLDRATGNVPRHIDADGVLFELVNWTLKEVGIDLRAANFLTVNDLLEAKGAAIPAGSGLSLLLAGTWYGLARQVDKYGRYELMPPDEYERDLNAILAQEGAKVRLRNGAWVTAAATDVELLCRVLLQNADEAVACRQGDVQVEMVASTVQTKLSAPNAVLVDYGAGVGRVLAGLASANNFKMAHYIAVDEPIPAAVRALAGRVGAKADFVESRTSFLASATTADVIMVVNTLHHIPFMEVATQLGGLAAKLRPGGILLVHEMGLLREPEQFNVPWKVEDLIGLFQGEAFTCNPRSTVSKSGVPLAHVLVSITGKESAADALARNVPVVWHQMKSRTLDDIRALYSTREPERHSELQHALITNANLDLNRPPGI